MQLVFRIKRCSFFIWRKVEETHQMTRGGITRSSITLLQHLFHLFSYTIKQSISMAKNNITEVAWQLTYECSPFFLLLLFWRSLENCTVVCSAVEFVLHSGISQIAQQTTGSKMTQSH